MNIFEMAREAVLHLQGSATPLKGGKSKEYRVARQELVDCAGSKWALQVLNEAFAKRPRRFH